MVSGPAFAQTTPVLAPDQAALVGLVQKAVVRATFSSSFVPSGDPTIVSQRDGVIQVAIPGTLKHTRNGSSTTYRVVIDVRATARPMKIEQLQQTVRRPS